MDTYAQISLQIAGESITPSDRSTVDIINPTDESIIGRVPLATSADLDAAIAAAGPAFDSWRDVSAFDRAQVIRRAAQLMRERVTTIATAMTLENGKTLAESRGEVLVSADTLDWLADEARRSYGRIVPSRFPDGRCMVILEPVGPVAAFTPWNAPALTVIRKVGSALAAGCSVVIKPSEETPATAQLIHSAFQDAGLPPAVFQLVFGDPNEVSAHLLASPVFRKATFTGSVAVGRLLAQRCAPTLKRVTLELGGHAPVIVCADADVDLAVREMGTFKVRHSGQVCAAPSRFFVHSTIYDEFVDKLTMTLGAVRVGNGMDPRSEMGSLTNRRRLDAMIGFVADAQQRGGKVTVGGQRIGGSGYFFEPTVIADATDDMRVMAGEVFGPIAPVARFDEIDEALERANSSDLGLTAFTFTSSEPIARYLSNRLEAGLVTVNTGGTSLPELPFGGVKQSGYGYEGGSEGLDAYQVRKLVNAY